MSALYSCVKQQLCTFVNSHTEKYGQLFWGPGVSLREGRDHKNSGKAVYKLKDIKSQSGSQHGQGIILKDQILQKNCFGFASNKRSSAAQQQQ